MNFTYTIEAYDPPSRTARVLYEPENVALNPRRRIVTLPPDVIGDQVKTDDWIVTQAPIPLWVEDELSVTQDHSSVTSQVGTPQVKTSADYDASVARLGATGEQSTPVEVV